ncbi:MAG: CHASE3 domain-containing protein, partial [Asticcacaulis sp.]
MKKTLLSGLTGPRNRSDLIVSLSLAMVAVFFVIGGFISWQSIRTVYDDFSAVRATHGRLLALNDLMSTVKDAETGQRGYLLTGEDSYLQPYNEARTRVGADLALIARLSEGDADMETRLPQMRAHLQAKLDELADTIALRRTSGPEAALAVVRTGRGKADMDALRAVVNDMQAAEENSRSQRIAETERAQRAALTTTVASAITGVIISLLITMIVSRTAQTRRRHEWLQAGQVGISAAMLGEQRLDQLGRNVLGYLADYCGASAGAFYTRDGSLFRRAATYGAPADNDVPEQFAVHEGLPGQAVAQGAPIVLRDLPQSHLSAGTALGDWRPRHVIIVPTRSDGVIDAVIELGFMNTLERDVPALLAQLGESINTAVRSANYRSSLQSLLEETQRQSEELQSQSEELRVNNEELEEQARALKDSHGRLEQQQAELETTNNQLEEQARILEMQKDELDRARIEVERKADELEQASRYKSDFLANMSHELRTPLNSSLILAKLLADNPEGNLSEEQVKFARTIQSSGNDLLVLINDILDLSKIEAGQMDIRPENVTLARVCSDMGRTFEPLAQQKGLQLACRLDAGLTPVIHTDRLRLEQVLKNLLSNAIKFTGSGSVTLDIAKAVDGRISFAVTDTGIGIPKEHQQAVFDAFRQADGTISRRYGGTGLGLSISRELARLLGGEIRLESEPGKGSSFTLTLPEVHDPAQVSSHAEARAAPAQPSARPAKKPASAPPAPPQTAQFISDDRDRLGDGARVILIVEDDVSFATILYELAHDQAFSCLVASNAED